MCPPRLRRCESSTGFPTRRSPRCQLSASQFPEQTPPWARRSAPPLLSPLQTPPCCQNSPGEQAALPPDSVPCHDQRCFQLKLLAPGRSGTVAFPKPPPEHLEQPEASILTRSTTGNVTAFFFFYCSCVRGHYLHTIKQQEVRGYLHITCRQALPAGLEFLLFCFLGSLFLQGRESKPYSAISFPANRGLPTGPGEMRRAITERQNKKINPC